MEVMPMDSFEKILFYTGSIATGLYLIKILIFAFTGVDHDIPEGNIDLDGTDSDSAFSFLSIQSIIAFFMGFGWAGLAVIKTQPDELYLVCIVAMIFGIMFMAFSAFLTSLMKRLDKRETFDMNQVVGTVGKTYTNFKPKNAGQIEIEINSKLTVTGAQNSSDEEIPAFTPVKVVKYENNTLYIEKA